MQHPAVTTTGMLPAFRLFIDEANASVRIATAKLAGNAHADNAATHDQEICAFSHSGKRGGIGLVVAPAAASAPSMTTPAFIYAPKYPETSTLSQAYCQLGSLIDFISLAD